MNQILYSKKNANMKVKKLTVIFCFLITLLIVLSISFALANKTNDKILKGVYLNNIYVGELTEESAKARIDEKLAKLQNATIELYYGDYSTKVTGKDLGVKYPDEIVDEAYNYGRSGNLLADNYTILATYFGKKNYIEVDYALDESKCNEVANMISSELSSAVKNDVYTIEDNEITLTKGEKGTVIKRDELINNLSISLSSDNTRLDIPIEIGNPQRVDFDDLYKQVYVEKVDASFSKEDGFNVTKEIVGKYFDKESAMKEYAELADGETMKIEILSVEPDVKVSDLNNTLFKDVLATYQTKYDKYYTSRANNLEVAARNINGTILYPDEEFSYNNVVGERTVKNGFKEAHVFEGGRVVDGLGGGICQVSSTLYNSVLLSNLEVTQRAAHMMHTGYVDPGRDATVVYGSVDFKFKNNRQTPIKIETICKNGICTATIYGLKEDDDPVVEIKTNILKVIPYTTVTEDDATMEEGTTQVVQHPLNGYVSETYKIVKDKNGNEISNTLISKDTYKQTSKIVKVGTKKVEPVVETPVEEPNSQTDKPSLPIGWDNPESPYVQ